MFPHVRLEHHRPVFEGEVFDAYRAIDFVDPHRMASAIGAVILPANAFLSGKIVLRQHLVDFILRLSFFHKSRYL